MNVAEWILVMFLSVALLVFLILAIVLTIKLIRVTEEVKKIVIKGQDIADKADDIVGNVKDMTSVGGLVKTLVNKYTKTKDNKKS
jgi:cell division protein FtsL